MRSLRPIVVTGANHVATFRHQPGYPQKGKRSSCKQEAGAPCCVRRWSQGPGSLYAYHWSVDSHQIGDTLAFESCPMFTAA